MQVAYHVGPCLVSNAETKLNDETEPEKGSEEGIGTDVGIVTIKCAFDRTVRADFYAEIRSRRWNSHCDGETGSVLVYRGTYELFAEE